MTVISHPQEFNEEELYVDLRSIFGHSLFLKCEGFNFAGSIKLKAATEMVEAAERDGILTPGLDPGRVLVRQPRRGAEHDRRQQGLPVPLRHRPPLQPGDQAADGGAGQPGAHRSPSRDPVGGLLGARIDYVRDAVRLRRPVRVAQPVHQPEQLEGALPHDGAGDRPRVPAAGRAVRRGRHHAAP